MNKRLLMVVLAGWVLVGCTQEIAPADYTKSETICAQNGGVDVLHVKEFGVVTFCKNGARFYNNSKAQ